MANTYGTAGSPASMTQNFDSLFSTSLANYKKKLIDNISGTNALLYILKKNGLWEGQDGGAYIAEDLMYALAPVDFYSGYDELPLTPTEGITQSQFQWRQMAGPVSISRVEERMNAQRIVNLVQAKLQQLEIALQEAVPKALLRGQLFNSPTGDIRLNPTSPITGATGFDPLPQLVSYTPTVSASVGNIAQDTNNWWRNNVKQSAASTTLAFMNELMNMYNTCSIGPFGPPDIILCDQISWELIHQSYRTFFHNNAMEDGKFPFPNLKFFSAVCTWEPWVANVAANAGAGSLDTTAANGGTVYFLNSKTFSMTYDSATNFIETDWQKPVNQDARYKHILFMGNMTINNRRKNGVIGNIARTLT